MTGYFGRANRGVPQDVHGQIAQQERLDMATRLPARIVAVAENGQTVTAEILYKPRFNGEPVDFPHLLNVPIEQNRGGGFAVGLPIRAGDYGFVTFAGRDTSAYHETGEAAPAPTARINSYSDGTFFPGGYPKSKPMSNYDRENAFFGTEDFANGFRVTPAGTVAIEGNGESLLQILADALDTLISSQDEEGPGFDPATRSALSAILSRLNTMKFR